MPTLALDGGVVVDVTIQNPPAVTLVQGNVANAEIYIAGPQGPKGEKGTVWLSGIGVPAGSLGRVGDWYLNTDNGDVYEKTGEFTWTLRDNLTGRAATDTAQTWTRPQTFAMAVGTDVPITVRANVSQTADLTRWQDSAGTVLGKVTASGQVRLAPDDARGGTAPLIVGRGDGVQNGIALLGAGTTDWRIYADTGARLTIGGANGNGDTFWEGRYAASPANLFQSPSKSTVAVVMAVRGAASQTADLQQWQDSSGATLARMANTGGLVVRNLEMTTTDFTMSNANPVIRMLTTANGRGWEMNTNAQVDINPLPYATNMRFYSANQQGLVFRTSTLVGGEQATTHVALVVKGVALQTADLSQWQDSAGALLARVTSAGHIYEGVNRVYTSANANLATTVVAETSFGIAAGVGVGTAFARNDHTHGTPPAQVLTAGSGISATASGVNYTIANTGVLTVAGRAGAVVLTSADVSGVVDLPSAQTITGVKTFTARQHFRYDAGAGVDYLSSQLEVYSSGTGKPPRIAFHIAGVVAQQIGSDDAGLRTFSQAGTGFANFRAAALFDNGNRVYSASNPIANMVTTDTTQSITGLKTFVPGITVGATTAAATNTIDFANPGVGGTQQFRFLRATDSAGIAVTEAAADSILYRFYMSDNPDSGDFFSWYMSDHQGGGNWEPIRIGAMTNQFIAPTNTVYGNAYFTDAPYYTGNAGVVGQVTKTGTGTLAVTPGLAGYTGVTTVFWAQIDGTPLSAPSALAATIVADATSTLAAATYYYVVSAVNATGQTTVSNEASAVIASGQRADLSWTAPTGTSASGITYDVHRSTTAGSGWVVIATGVSTTTYSDLGAAATATAAPTANTTKNSFKWGNGSLTTAAVATGVTVTGGAQALNNGATVTFNATTGGVMNDLYQFRANRGGLVRAGRIEATKDVHTDAFMYEKGRRVRGNWGQHTGHSTFTDFNNPGMDFGAEFVQGTANGPGIPGTSQYYNMNLSLGSQYPMQGPGSYAMQFAIPRNNAANPYPAVRWKENNAWTAWTKIKAGYADTAGTATPSNDANLVHKDGTETVTGIKTFNAGTHLFGGASVGTDPLVNGWLAVGIKTATNMGIVVRGAASQTADLTQWQDSAGAVLARIESNGVFRSPVVNAANVNVSSQLRGNYEIVSGAQASGGAVLGSLSAFAWAADIKPIVARGFSGQTADLQQWQDSAGNVLARVANDGTIYKGSTAVGGNAADTEIMAIMGAF